MIIASLKSGTARVSQTKRMVALAWGVNVLFALALALPLLTQLNGYLRTSTLDEKLLKQMDAAWFETYQFDFEKSEIAKLMDYSIFSYAPFFNHLEAQLSGTFVKAIGGFLYDLILRFEINPKPISLLFGLGFFYVCISNFLAGGFIGMYAKDYRTSLNEFFIDSARYFGKLFRLSLFSLLVYYLLFAIIVTWVTDAIPLWTRNASSEAIPFRYYMVVGGLTWFVLSVFSMIFDYARIRIVVEDRTSVVAAAFAGARFAYNNFFNTFGLYLLLGFIGIVFVAMYALLESQISQTSFWLIVLVFVLQQLYMIVRFWLKAIWYASQTFMFRESSAKQHITSVMNAPLTNPA